MNFELNKRQHQIIEQLKIKGEVKIADLKELFKVTDMTIRRDLEKLEKYGLLKRTFGGAVLIARDVALSERSAAQIFEKEKIGRAAAQLIQSGESVFIDGGSTTLQIARHLPEHAEITVVTNAINIAAELSRKKIRTIITGGVLVEETETMVGPIAIEVISQMVFDKTFLGGTGLSIEHGFSNSNILEAEIKRLAMKKAKNAYVVLDHTKFGVSSLFSFASLGEPNAIITDQLPDSDLRLACQKAKIEIILA